MPGHRRRASGLSRTAANLTVAVLLIFGIFRGVSVVGRELETGTATVAWTQSPTPSLHTERPGEHPSFEHFLPTQTYETGQRSYPWSAFWSSKVDMAR